MFSIRLIWQLFLTYLLIIVLSLTAVTYFASTIVSDNYRQRNLTDLAARAYLIQEDFVSKLLPTVDSSLDSICKVIGKRSNTRITVILPDGRVVADSEKDPSSMDNHGVRPEIKMAFDGTLGSSIRFSSTLQKKLMYVAIPLTAANEKLAVLRVSMPLTFIEKSLDAIENRIIFTVFIVAFIAAMISLILSRQLSKPIEEMKKGVGHFTRGDFNFRMAKIGSEEMRELSMTLNRMAEQIDEKIQAVMEQKNEQQAVLESMVEGVVALDKNEKIINLNQAAARLFHVKSRDIVGAKIIDVINNMDLQNLIKKTLTSNYPVEEEIILQNKSDHFLQVHGTVLKNDSGATMGAVIVLNDVTRLRRLENVRRDFVANVSHEIKTPLTSIKGFAETLLDGAIEDQANSRKFIDIIAKQSNRLNAIIEDLLTLASLEQEGEREQLEFKFAKIKLVIESALQICLPKAEEKGVTIQIQCPDDLNVKHNAALLEQAVVNLIDNAIKYSLEENEIIIAVESIGEEIMINVTDPGVGIAKKHLPRLFERFYRVDKARSRHLGGTGLGLAIVKHIAQVHSGRVWVESSPGKGSSFRIFIPQ